MQPIDNVVHSPEGFSYVFRQMDFGLVKSEVWDTNDNLAAVTELMPDSQYEFSVMFPTPRGEDYLLDNGYVSDEGVDPGFSDAVFQAGGRLADSVGLNEEIQVSQTREDFGDGVVQYIVYDDDVPTQVTARMETKDSLEEVAGLMDELGRIATSSTPADHYSDSWHPYEDESTDIMTEIPDSSRDLIENGLRNAFKVSGNYMRQRDRA